MEFLNIGGGEVLVIILLALILFGPEDIMQLMRTIGKYTRAASKMWAQVTQGLQEGYLPEEVEETLVDTQNTVAEARGALQEAETSIKDVTRELDRDLNNISKDNKKAAVSEAQETIDKAQSSVEAVTESVEKDLNEISESIDQALEEPEMASKPSESRSSTTSESVDLDSSTATPPTPEPQKAESIEE
jgi:Sec-independent protein translocase protein TatA